MKAIQRVVKNGSSAQVTINRPMLFRLNLRPGDFVELEDTDDGCLLIRPWKNQENGPRSSPGIVSPAAPAVAR